MKYKKLIFICSVLFVISVVYNSPIILIPLNNVYDEGLILVGADRILKGHLPYMHFWSMYPPGQFYALALLFKLFGSSVFVERIYDVIIKSLLPVFSFLIIRKLGFSNKIAIISWGMVLIGAGSAGFTAYPVYAAILFIFISVYFCIYHIEKNQVHLLVFSGSFMTFGAMFRHDLAGMVAFAAIITLFLRKVTNTGLSYRPIFYYLFAVLLTALPVSIYLINAIGIHPMINQLIITPADIMPKYRWLPYPSSISLNTIQFFIFPLILLTGLVASLMLIIKHKTYSKFSYGMFLLSLLGIFLY